MAIGVVGLLLSWRWVEQIVSEYGRFLDRTVSAAQAGRSAPDVGELSSRLVEPVLIVTLVFGVVQLAYEAGFLKALQATPGKLLLRLHVRPRTADGVLSWRAVLLRWAGKWGVGVLQLVPLGALVQAVYVLLDYLWPLWDNQRQALHDKLPGTVVVRR